MYLQFHQEPSFPTETADDEAINIEGLSVSAISQTSSIEVVILVLQVHWYSICQAYEHTHTHFIYHTL